MDNYKFVLYMNVLKNQDFRRDVAKAIHNVSNELTGDIRVHEGDKFKLRVKETSDRVHVSIKIRNMLNPPLLLQEVGGWYTELMEFIDSQVRSAFGFKPAKYEYVRTEKTHNESWTEFVGRYN